MRITFAEYDAYERYRAWARSVNITPLPYAVWFHETCYHAK
jgi:hypothetical protein